jgi:hypothetical protein
LPGIEAPSMVRNKTYVFTSKDKKIDFAHGDAYVKSKLSHSKAKKIYSYVNSVLSTSVSLTLA